MGAIFNPPKPPAPREPIIDQREAADVGIAIDAEAGRSIQRRMSAARNRVNRSSLQIPRNSGSTGVSIPR